MVYSLRYLMLIVLCFSVLAGCANGRYRNVNYIHSSPVIDGGTECVDGVVYYLPQTKISGTVPAALVEYKVLSDGPNKGKLFTSLEVRGTIELVGEVIGDPGSKFVLVDERVKKNVFTYSDLKFNLDSLGLLTSVSADIQDKRIEAFKEGLSIVSKLATMVATGGLPIGPLNAMAEFTNVPFTTPPLVEEVRVIKTASCPFEFIPSTTDLDEEIKLADYFRGVSPDTVESVTITVDDDVATSTVAPLPNCVAVINDIEDQPNSIYYRHPEPHWVEINLANTTFSYYATFKRVLPFTQFSSINAVPVGGKPFTNRNTTVTFENGALTEYGVKSESSADKVLKALNDALITANQTISTIQSHEQELENQKREREAQEKAKSLTRIQNLKALQDCLKANPGGDCSAEWQAILGDVINNS